MAKGEKSHAYSTRSHYADKHRGICLGFEINDKTALTVKYVPERIKVSDGRIQDLRENNELASILWLTKFEHWHYENEVRRVEELALAENIGRHYFRHLSKDLQLKEVIIGLLSHRTIRGK